MPVKTFGLAQEFLDHGSRDEILEHAGLTPQHLARQLTEAVARRTPAAAEPVDGSATHDTSTQERLPE
jgi:1-deoxy-D-xylulose-5-phosphate synthase